QGWPRRLRPTTRVLPSTAALTGSMPTGALRWASATYSPRMDAFSSRSDPDRGRTWRRFLHTPGSPSSGARGGATLPAGPALSSLGSDPGLHSGAWRQKRTWKSRDNRVRFVTENDYWAISRRAGGAWTGCKGNTSVFS